jgi:hypothetical protein
VLGWSATLRNAIDMALHTRFPITLLWGPEFVLLYNEAFVRLIADKHPDALGTPARDVFPEAWEALGPMMESVLAGRGATWVEDERVPLWRNGRLDECYFTFSYSAVRDEQGRIEGVMDIAAETTRRVLDRRRLELLGTLGAALGEVEHAADVPVRALPVLRAATDDLPWVDVRLGRDDAPEAGVTRLTLPGADGVLLVRLSKHLAPDDGYVGFLRLIAASIGQALTRIAARDADRDISVAIQRSLLARPAHVPGLDLAVRYRPAGEQAGIGGDWYDAFELPDGSLTVVVGDVTGHDEYAAAAMAQVRNLLRGVAWTVQGSPAQVLAGLDRAMDGLAVDVFATAVLAQVGAASDHGTRALAWSNAGHLPPVLVTPDGAARLLASPPDVLLGLGDAARVDHAHTLQPGAAIVVYTDGLIERRGVSLVDSLAWLVGALEGQAGRTADELCDHVVDQLEGTVEDDVALLVLRVAPGWEA